MVIAPSSVLVLALIALELLRQVKDVGERDLRVIGIFAELLVLDQL